MKLSDLFEAPKPRKLKEPEWFDDYPSGYSRLRDIQQGTTVFRPLGVQLFVPKHYDPKMLEKAAQNRRWAEVKREVDADLKEEAPPILTAYSEAPPGDNKPGFGFWTSSAIKKGGGYTSDWYEYVKSNISTWQTDYGYLFEVDKSAMVFDISNAERYYHWAADSKRLTKKKADYYQEYTRDDMRHRFPWDQLARHFDAAHNAGSYSSHDEFSYGWDVESTVWFNTGPLKYKGAVKLWNGRTEDDE